MFKQVHVDEGRARLFVNEKAILAGALYRYGFPFYSTGAGPKCRADEKSPAPVRLLLGKAELFKPIRMMAVVVEGHYGTGTPLSPPGYPQTVAVTAGHVGAFPPVPLEGGCEPEQLPEDDDVRATFTFNCNPLDITDIPRARKTLVLFVICDDMLKLLHSGQLVRRLDACTNPKALESVAGSQVGVDVAFIQSDGKCECVLPFVHIHIPSEIHLPSSFQRSVSGPLSLTCRRVKMSRLL